MSISRVAVVGAGILGVAAAREITLRLPEAQVTVFDKAEHLAAHQSGHTSGIVDSGLDRIPGTPEAQLARRGIQLLVPFVTERGIPYRECGQLLIAQDTDEAERIEELFAQAKENGVPGVRLLERTEIREVEPAARGVLGLYSPHAAVTDFAALVDALASDVRAAGGTFRFGTEVTGFDAMSNRVRLRGRTAVAGPDDHDASDEHDANDDHDAADDHDASEAVAQDGTASPQDAGPDDIDDQVHEVPRTYRGEDTTGPVSDFADEMRSRFGGQDWFDQVEGTVSDWTEKLSNSWSRRTEAREPKPRSAGADSSGTRTDSASGPHRGAAEEALGTFDLVLICGGLQADRLAAAAGFDAEPRIVPFIGDYYEVRQAEAEAGTVSRTSTGAGAEAVRGIIGSVPDPLAPFAETGIVRGVNESLMLGPNTFVALGREKYVKRGFDLSDMGSTAKFKGFWKFAAQTARTAAAGAKPVLSRAAFVDSVRKYVPGIDAEAVSVGPRGVRAQAMNDEGGLLDELTVTTRGRLTAVRSVPRGAATSALAIAEDIVERALAGAG